MTVILLEDTSTSLRINVQQTTGIVQANTEPPCTATWLLRVGHLCLSPQTQLSASDAPNAHLCHAHPSPRRGTAMSLSLTTRQVLHSNSTT